MKEIIIFAILTIPFWILSGLALYEHYKILFKKDYLSKNEREFQNLKYKVAELEDDIRILRDPMYKLESNTVVGSLLDIEE